LEHGWSRTRLGLVLGLCVGSASAAAQPSDKAVNAAPPSPAQTAPAQTGAAAPVRHFDILEYVVDGNTVLDAPDIEEAVYPYLGESRTADDVDRARNALQDVYQKRGFQTVQISIPQQGVETGIIHLQVTENAVGRLRVVDSKYHLPSEIKETAPSVAEGQVINSKDVQKDIVALNQQASLK